MLKNVFEAADARQKQAKKRSLSIINEHFEPVFNTAAATQIVFQRPVKAHVVMPLFRCGLQRVIDHQRTQIHFPPLYLIVCMLPLNRCGAVVHARNKFAGMPGKP